MKEEQPECASVGFLRKDAKGVYHPTGFGDFIERNEGVEIESRGQRTVYHLNDITIIYIVSETREVELKLIGRASKREELIKLLDSEN